MAQIVVRELDNQRTAFEAAVTRLGGNVAKRAFARAMNHEGRKAMTAVRRSLRQQTGIKAGDISAGTRFRTAKPHALAISINASGKPLPLKYFGARQFSYGVRAKPWNRSQRFEGAFIVGSLGANAFIRTSAARFPIQKLWGPAIPTEMVKGQSLAAFEARTAGIAERALHEAARIIDGQ